MTHEEGIQAELIKKFPALENNIQVRRTRRIFAKVPLKDFEEVLKFTINHLEFPILSAITGLDEGESLSFIYHLSKENGIMLNLKISVDKKDPILKTITEYFPAAEFYERELADLLGTKVRGLPEGKRYPLSDDWPAGEYPLRKDWKKKSSTPTEGV